MSTMFAALMPDAGLAGLVNRYKDAVRGRVGPQLYLDHPPHATLYLSAFPAGVEVDLALAPLAGLAAPRVRVVGWHLFEGDPLTGLHTLVCDLAEADRVALREVQRRAVEALAPLRDEAGVQARFAGRFAHLSEAERANVASFGFPYVGDGWRPHFTVASIKPEDWAAVADELLADPPVGEFVCPELRWFRLGEDGEPVQAGDLAFTG